MQIKTLQTSKAGKHGHAKVVVVGTDIMEDDGSTKEDLKVTDN